MTTHAEAAPATHDHAAESSAPLDGLRFEKSELKEFGEADRTAGEQIGVMLAVLFCISLGLFVSVSTWMIYNSSEGHDPHAIAGASDEHH